MIFFQAVNSQCIIVNLIKSNWEVFLTIITLNSLFSCMISQWSALFVHFRKLAVRQVPHLLIWANKSAIRHWTVQVGLLKVISQDQPRRPIYAESVLRREKQSSRREAKNLKLKQGRLIHTSRIIASQTERSLSVADTTELCSLSPPSHLADTLSSAITKSKEEWSIQLLLNCKCKSLL